MLALRALALRQKRGMRNAKLFFLVNDAQVCKNFAYALSISCFFLSTHMQT